MADSESGASGGSAWQSQQVKRIVFVLLALASPVYAQDPLPSWNDTAPKKAIVDFVEKVTKEGSPDFVPPSERIATFDNDGTLWAEQPIYFQFAFAIDRVKALAPQHPEWKKQQPFATVLSGDKEALVASGQKGLMEIMAVSHSGMSTEEFARIVAQWFATARHPRFNRPYTDLVYQPMLELLAYMRSNGFKTYIVSGGGVEFMRVFADKSYGIPPEQVVGSSAVTKLSLPLMASLSSCASRRFCSSMTGRAKRKGSTRSSGAGPSSPLATPTATSRCSSGQLRRTARASWALYIIPTPNANGPTTARVISANSTKLGTKPSPKVGPSSA
jgi:phosphoglycolate phosphatase-like HAD superfamily hydrolase